MCGRFTLKTPPETVARLFELDEVPHFGPRYNVAPTQQVAAIRRKDATPRRELVFLRWGLVPFWAKDTSGAARAINARSETVAEKPSFRESFKRRRCLILADGYYEWEPQGKIKQPYRIHRPNDELFAFAGLWDSWNKEGPAIETCTILTAAAPPKLKGLHERAPVILEPDQYEAWLAGTAGIDTFRLNDEDLLLDPVSTLVNSVRNDSPACIAPIASLF